MDKSVAISSLEYVTNTSVTGKVLIETRDIAISGLEDFTHNPHPGLDRLFLLEEKDYYQLYHNNFELFL